MARRIEHHWSLKPGVAGKGLKELLPTDVYRVLEQTYVGPGIGDNWTALFDTIALFRSVAIEVADHLGYQYPRDLDDRVTTYLVHVQSDSRRT